MAIPLPLNPLASFKLPGLGTVGSVLLLVTLSGLVVIMFGILLFIMTTRKSFWIRIHVFRLIGNTPTRVGTFRAKEQSVGRAGDNLWRVAPSGLAMAFKIIKWLPVGKYQSAPKEFWYWIRHDGEWINFILQDLDAISKEMKIKFIKEDMRLQRLATERLLAERLLKKNFWEKYGIIIMYMIFFLVITVSMVIIFYQWSQIADKIGILVNILRETIEITQGAGTQGLVPT